MGLNKPNREKNGSLNKNFIANSYFLSIISGILLILSFPKPDLGILAWVVLLPFLYGINMKTHLQGFFCGFLMGEIFFIGTIYWLIYTFVVFGDIPLVFAIPLLLLLTSYLSLYPATFGYLTNYIRRRSYLPYTIIGPPLWISLDLLRGRLLTGFPWVLLGYTQYKFLPIMQLSDTLGISGITFLVVLVNCAIFDFMDSRLPRGERYKIAIGTLSIWLVFLFYGLWRINTPIPIKGNIKVAIIQGGVPQDIKWERDYREVNYSQYLNMTVEAADKGAQLIIWPEAATAFRYKYYPRYIKMLEDIVKEKKIWLLFGTPDGTEQESFNSAFLYNPDGHIIGEYSKIHLVPFGEYVPLKNSILFWVDKLVPVSGDFQPGNNLTVMDVDKYKISVFICYENIFGDLVRRFRKKGAEILVNISNEAWFGKTSATYQITAMCVARAIENRTPLLRSANTGFSFFADEFGRIRKKTGLFTKEIIYDNVDVPVYKPTIYAKHGEWFGYFCLLISIFLILYLKFLKRSYKGVGNGKHS